MNLSKFTTEGKFLMLALDHRGSIKKLINPQNPNSVTDDTVIQLKSEIIQALSNQFSGLLIDEVWGLEACQEVCQYKPYLLPLEKTGYIDEDGERITEVEYSVEQIKEMGASGAKLLVYFNPNAESAVKQIETVKKVRNDCKSQDLPFFLEIVTYSTNTGSSIENRYSIVDRGIETNLVIESVRAFKEVEIVPDVWKLEYPGNLDGCLEITNLVGNTPWILLTGGTTFEVFKNQLIIAIKAGAKGFLAGRALWQEVCRLEGDGKKKFLEEILPKRFKEIAALAGSSQ